MFDLSYNGQKRVESNPTKQAHDLLDNLLNLHTADSPIDVDVGQVRPRDGGNALALLVSLSAESDMSTLQSVEDTLAGELVTLGVEPDVKTAKEQIQINN
jgi:hypothetical protein